MKPAQSLKEAKERFEKALESQFKSCKVWVDGFYRFKDRSAAINAGVSLGKFQGMFFTYQSIFCEDGEVSEEIMAMFEELRQPFTDIFKNGE